MDKILVPYLLNELEASDINDIYENLLYNKVIYTDDRRVASKKSFQKKNTYI